MCRSTHFPVSVLGALVIASCYGPPPAPNSNCEYRTAADGTVECIPVEQSPQDVMGPNTSNSGGPGPVPDLGGPMKVPDLGSPPPSSSSPGPADTSNPAPTTTGGPAPSDTSNPAPTTTGGPAPSDTNTPNPTPTAGPAPSDTSVPTPTAPVPTDDSMNPPAGGNLGSIQVSAGSLARDHSIVSFSYPDGAGKNLVLEDAEGTQIPLHMHPVNGNAIFVLPSLAAGAQAVFAIKELPAPLPAGMTAAVEGDHLYVSTAASRVFRWTLIPDNFRGAAARDVRAGYIYPVYTPGGLNVADDYQVDHPHMHGIWSAWVNTTFRGHKVDFWNGYANQGRVDLESMEGLWSGPVHAGLVANLDHIDITTTPNIVALNERWVVTVYKTHADPAPYFVYDIDSVQEAASNDALVLEQYHYGGFGYRGSEEWQTPANMAFLTSEGHTRANADGQNARWCAQYGTVGGKRAGYAAFDHPTNFRHPQGLRIHPTNPYWAFVPVTPLKGGRFSIEPGKPYPSLYRIVAFDGDADATLLNRLWEDFATPPTVQLLP